jgi:transketolase
MELTKQALEAKLQEKAYTLRRWSLITTTEAQSGHPTSCLSAADIAAVLWFHTMKLNPDNVHDLSNDYFILSKGHAAPLLYAVWHELGFVSSQELMTLRHFDSVLEGHPTPRFPCVDVATGSLGIGLSIGFGVALNKRINHANSYTYVLMGDSEVAEGSVWETAENAAHYKLNHLIAVVDMNRLGQSGETLDDHHVEQQQARWLAFGWNAIIVDGHSIPDLIRVFDAIKNTATDKPTAIIAKTYKGYGVSAFENKEGFHGKPLTKAELPAALAELKQRFAPDYEPSEQVKKHTCQIKKTYAPQFTAPELPAEITQAAAMATRKAFGIALREYGVVVDKLVVLDAEVKNSTYTELFEQKFPQRFVECFIAEQCMIGAATGFAATGAIPFAATFGAFLTRAHDQIRMAAISRAPVRLMGSHAGVSIGEDGPSQMALEDLGMMRALPDSIVLYPADAFATFKLVEQMIRYNTGVSYMRTTRAATPKLYDEHATFTIGGCTVLRQSNNDVACIVTAGITLFEALKAHETLTQENIFVSVIDCYSIKPLDITTIRTIGKQSQSRIITVEDHYPEGGLGEAVCSALINDNIHIEQCAVTRLPRSGKPEELMRFEAIDAQAIISRIRSMLLL